MTGRVPSAYLVTDRAPTPQAALAVYVELARDWQQVVACQGDLGTVFPFQWPHDESAAGRLASLLDAVAAVAALPERERAAVSAWIDASRCPVRDEPRARVPASARDDATLRPGLLAADHRGFGLLLEAVVRPSPSWLARLRDTAVRESQDESWWRLACLDGGSVYVPASLLSSLGDPTQEQVELALANANEFGKRAILAALARAGER